MTEKRGATAKKAKKPPRDYGLGRFHTVAEEKVYDALKANAEGLSLELADIHTRAVLEFLRARTAVLSAGGRQAYLQPLRSAKPVHVVVPPEVSKDMQAAALEDNVSERKFLYNALHKYYEGHLGGK